MYTVYVLVVQYVYAYIYEKQFLENDPSFSRNS